MLRLCYKKTYIIYKGSTGDLRVALELDKSINNRGKRNVFQRYDSVREDDHEIPESHGKSQNRKAGKSTEEVSDVRSCAEKQFQICGEDADCQAES